MRVNDGWETTADGVYSCGDATRGASLVVWAIAEGRACAAAVDNALSGRTKLPAPVRPGARPL
jgi:glutamate synthase (NADPH/NADH) small chain